MADFDKLVQKERLRQYSLWGEQNHRPVEWLAILMEEIGEVSKAIVEYHFHTFEQQLVGHLGDPIAEELTHVAAVAKAMYESGCRNHWWEDDTERV